MVDPAFESHDPEKETSPAGKSAQAPEVVPSWHGEDPTADRYEFQLEIVGSVVLALIGLVLSTKVRGKLGEPVGANLLAAGCIGLVVFVAYGYLFRNRSQRRSAEQSRALTGIAEACERIESRDGLEVGRMQRVIDDGLARSLSVFDTARKIGLAGFDVGRPVQEINEAVLRARKTVDILEISLRTMQNIDADRWRGCEADIRIMLLDPLFPPERPLACQRDSEEGQGAGQILVEIHEILKTFPAEWFWPAPAGSPSSISDEPNPDGGGTDNTGAHVKLARVMPTLSYFRIDGVAYFAPLVHKQLGHVTMHLRLREGGELFAALSTHFEKLWNDLERVVTVRPNDIPRQYTQ
ncbi:MAG TPA: hypothetical protein VHT29_03360 [Solirubrobacteraceae bacterium]|jgi:hypothetical protein|nr:hypothetical protein [Solirubrobacteraceae bacterium]